MNQDTIKEQLRNHGYSFAVAVATQAEINAGAACGQLALVVENEKEGTPRGC